MKKYLTSLLIAAVFTVSTLFLPASTALADATYSCGAYGAGAYSAQTNCDGVTPPNTGFAKFMQPDILVPTAGSFVALAAGVGVVIFQLRKRRSKTEK